MVERSTESLKWRRVLPVAGITAVYLLAAAVAAVLTGNGEFIFYVVIMLVLIGAVLAVHLRVGLSVALLWCLSVWGGLHMAGGLIPVPESWPINGEIRVLYSWWIIPGVLKFDQIIHAYGFGIATWLCWEALNGALRPSLGRSIRPTIGLMLLMVAAGSGLGATNEVIEFIATRFMDTNVGGYVNTGWDLVANLIGSSLAAAIIVFADRS